MQGTKYSELMFEWLESRLKLWVFRKCTKQSWAILSWDLYWLNIWRFTCHLLLIQRFKSLVPPKPWVRSTQLGWVGLDFWVTETSPLKLSQRIFGLEHSQNNSTFFYFEKYCTSYSLLFIYFILYFIKILKFLERNESRKNFLLGVT